MSDLEQRAVESVRAGTPDWAAIYEAYGEPMMRTAVKVLGVGESATQGQSAVDVVGKVFEDLLGGEIVLDSADADSLRPFLRAVVRNRAVTLVRRSAAESRAGFKGLAVNTTDVAEDVATQVLAEMAEERMYLLNEKEHRALVERVQHGRPAKEVAGELGVTPQRVSQLVTSALRKLRADPAFIDALSNDQPVTRPSEREEGTP